MPRLEFPASLGTRVEIDIKSLASMADGFNTLVLLRESALEKNENEMLGSSLLSNPSGTFLGMCTRQCAEH